MKILVLAVGKLKDKRIASLSGEYLSRIHPDGAVTTEHIPDPTGPPADRVEREGQEVLRRIRPRDRLVLLREDGKEQGSMEFAQWLSREMAATEGRLVLVIGGPWGASKTLLRRADADLSLSRMTFTHEMCFLFLAEQLYRAFSILQGSGYHH
ncbi:MAG: 23S rRNA (pseudouridine(1915)-N(3))-methyltransferase RlmH [Synergistaceae bacterium]|jgi:23S rRNA (pseudouridine1915-N3)-methyltransferase|nr:23S rRNA (pseudouridine(1915)-N(3))-methyltransferase RlmH [Synergistaceae bacterium]